MPEDFGDEEGGAGKAGARESLAEGTALMAYAFDPQIRVRAVSKDNSNYMKEGANSLPTIVKNCSIRFELINANQLPQGSAVRWMVRNRGHEARNKNDIGHYSGDAYVSDEHSAYNGNHAMNLTIYQYGASLAGAGSRSRCAAWQCRPATCRTSASFAADEPRQGEQPIDFFHSASAGQLAAQEPLDRSARELPVDDAP